MDLAMDQRYRALIGDLCRGDAMAFAQRRAKAGVVHAERLEDAASGEHIERLARHPLDQRTEHDVADVTVQVALARLHLEAEIEDAPKRLHRAIRVVLERVDDRQPGGVEQELPNRDRGLALGPELPEVLGHRVIQIQPTLFDQLLNQRRSDDGFREGCQIEDGVLGHGQRRGQERALAICASHIHAIATPDDHHRARHSVLPERACDQGIDLRDIEQWHRSRLGARRRDWGRRRRHGDRASGHVARHVQQGRRLRPASSASGRQGHGQAGTPVAKALEEPRPGTRSAGRASVQISYHSGSIRRSRLATRGQHAPSVSPPAVPTREAPRASSASSGHELRACRVRARR